MSWYGWMETDCMVINPYECHGMDEWRLIAWLLIRMNVMVWMNKICLKIWCTRDFLVRSFPTWLSMINEDNETKTIVFRIYSVLIFFKIQYEITIPIVTCRYLEFHYENIISLLVIHSQIWHVSRDLHPRNITMLGSNMSPDVTLHQASTWNPSQYASLMWIDKKHWHPAEASPSIYRFRRSIHCSKKQKSVETIAT